MMADCVKQPAAKDTLAEMEAHPVIRGYPLAGGRAD